MQTAAHQLPIPRFPVVRAQMDCHFLLCAWRQKKWGRAAHCVWALEPQGTAALGSSIHRICQASTGGVSWPSPGNSICVCYLSWCLSSLFSLTLITWSCVGTASLKWEIDWIRSLKPRTIVEDRFVLLAWIRLTRVKNLQLSWWHHDLTWKNLWCWADSGGYDRWHLGRMVKWPWSPRIGFNWLLDGNCNDCEQVRGVVENGYGTEGWATRKEHCWGVSYSWGHLARDLVICGVTLPFCTLSVWEEWVQK